MSFKDFIYPLTFWYYEKDLSLTDRVIAGFFLILILPIAPVILASEHENSATYSTLSSLIFKIYVIAMWVITIAGISLLVIL